MSFSSIDQILVGNVVTIPRQEVVQPLLGQQIQRFVLVVRRGSRSIRCLRNSLANTDTRKCKAQALGVLPPCSLFILSDVKAIITVQCRLPQRRRNGAWYDRPKKMSQSSVYISTRALSHEQSGKAVPCTIWPCVQFGRAAIIKTQLPCVRRSIRQRGVRTRPETMRHEKRVKAYKVESGERERPCTSDTFSL